MSLCVNGCDWTDIVELLKVQEDILYKCLLFWIKIFHKVNIDIAWISENCIIVTLQHNAFSSLAFISKAMNLEQTPYCKISLHAKKIGTP